MHDFKKPFLSAWRLALGRYLPVLTVLSMLVGVAGPALAASPDDGVAISGAIAEEVLTEQLQKRQLTPSDSDLTLKDYIHNNAGQARFNAVVGVWLDAKGEMVPSPEWQDRHKDYCKNRARSPREATQLLGFKMIRVREKADGEDRSQYFVFAHMMDRESGKLLEQHEGGSSVSQPDTSKSGMMNNPDFEGLPPAFDAAWDGLNPSVSAPKEPCGDLRVKHVSGDAVGEQIEFLAGYKGSYGPSLEYSWDFGDGATSDDGGKNPRHVYAKEGTYTVAVTVKGKVDNKSIKPATGTVSAVIGDNELKLVFSSRIEQTFPDGRFMQEFQSTVPLTMSGDSVFEGQAPLHSVLMENTFQADLMNSMNCSLSPRDGVLKVSATLPGAAKGTADGVEVTLTMPSDQSRPLFQTVPGVDVNCPPVTGFATMMKKVLDGMGAHWWMAFQMLHQDDLKGKGEYGFSGWHPSNDPGVIARKTYSREQRIDSDQTMHENTTIEIRGGSVP